MLFVSFEYTAFPQLLLGITGFFVDSLFNFQGSALILFSSLTSSFVVSFSIVPQSFLFVKYFFHFFKRFFRFTHSSFVINQALDRLSCGLPSERQLHYLTTPLTVCQVFFSVFSSFFSSHSMSIASPLRPVS